ncbi:hypothetical protein E0L36_22255 [Streptomyces sp. AJS327]|uniref:hypothetical protein n=1 Tax=Streptomyces sp. AJS327 TaxID=2545265 RepID=UPI0015DDF99C|nr:hypothetical protein [Streptomyces sp. AJS327]MBA0053501.1 hypothetical protein [Streptomyces sp. AJS327]
MNPLVLAAVIAAAVLIPAIILVRRASMAPPKDAPHNPRTCARCASMRHPSQLHANSPLFSLPRQRSAPDHRDGGAS